MQEAVATMKIEGADARRIGDLFRAEAAAYRRLLRLAVRQNRYMRRHDLERLEANAAEWRRYLPAAETAKRRREGFLAGMAHSRGLDPARVSMAALVEWAGPVERDAVREAVAVWQKACAGLHRQNAMNGLLARFCIDLIRDQAALFREGVTGHPAGCYDGDGSPAARSAAGVIERKA